MYRYKVLSTNINGHSPIGVICFGCSTSSDPKMRRRRLTRQRRNKRMAPSTWILQRSRGVQTGIPPISRQPADDLVRTWKAMVTTWKH